MPDINQIKEYVDKDKPINSSSAKDWLRYLLQENERLTKLLKEESK